MNYMEKKQLIVSTCELAISRLPLEKLSDSDLKLQLGTLLDINLNGRILSSDERMTIIETLFHSIRSDRCKEDFVKNEMKEDSGIPDYGRKRESSITFKDSAKSKIYPRNVLIPVALVLSIAVFCLLAVNLDERERKVEDAEIFRVGWSDADGGREAYTIEDINANILGDRVALNSISNGKIGHEFNFVGAIDNTEIENICHADIIVAEEDTCYKVRLYFENSTLYESAIGVRAKYEISDPVKVNGNDIDVEGFDSSNGYYAVAVYGTLLASNSDPEWVRDGVKFVSNKPFHLEYVPGTARLHNMGIGIKDGHSLPNAIVGDWVTLGYDELNGVIPAGYEYDGQCTILVVPVFD